MKFSCAGKREIRAEAVRRHRLHASKLKMDFSSTISQAIPPLGERSQSFADAFRMAIRKSNADNLCLLQDSLLACRALASFSLSISAGLARSPILLMQLHVTSEI